MFHLNPATGNPNRCTAKEDNCPFGAEAPHFETKAAARESYEYQEGKRGYLETLRKTREGLNDSRPAEEPTPKGDVDVLREGVVRATAEVFAEPFRKPELPREREYSKGLHESVVSATAKAFREGNRRGKD